jgi:hypothetical protein
MTDPVPMTSTRRAILAAGVPLVLAAVAVCTKAWVNGAVIGLANQHEIGYPVAFTAPLSGGAARVTSQNGNMTVQVGPGRRIGVSGHVAGAVVRPRFVLQTAPLNFYSQCLAPTGNCSSTYTVTVPGDVPVDVSNSFGNLDTSGLRGSVKLYDNSGNLTASGLAGHVTMNDQFGNLSTGGLSGTVTLVDNSGNLNASGVTGNINLTDSFGNIGVGDVSGSISLSGSSGGVTAVGLTGNTQIRDGYGNVAVSGISAGDVRCYNQSGNITISFTTVPRLVVVDDSFGNITLLMPPGDATYRVATTNSFGTTTVRVPRSPSATNSITATDNSGNITIVSRGGAPPPSHSPGRGPAGTS